MDQQGKIILNGDDPLLWNLHKTLSQATYFGVNNEESAVRGTNVETVPEYLSFIVTGKDSQFRIELGLEGEHYVLDALAAITVGMELGVPEKKICQALASFENTAGRQEIFQAGDYTIISDCYNAGPESVAAALNVLSSRTGRRVAVLGDMLELGSCTQAEHYKIGRLAAEKADLLFAYGPNSTKMLKGALTGGMSDTKCRAVTYREKLVNALKQLAKPGDVMLFKGSRGMKMELALEGFLKDTNSEEK